MLRVIIALPKINHFFSSSFILFPIMGVMLFAAGLSGCASSAVSREAATNVDLGVYNAKRLVFGDRDIAVSYQNTSQTAKGAVIGGAVGALAGGATAFGAVPGALTGAVFGASYGAYIDSTTNKRDRLENRGVATVVIGDEVMIVIPSALIFDEMTSHVKPQAYSTLRMVAQYINRYTKIGVRVAGYTYDSGNCNIDLALSKQQAEVVKKFLIAENVNARLIYAMGMGSSRLVDTSANWDSDNYRIEITFEKLHV